MNAILLAFIASVLCWAATAAGAALVFLVPRDLSARKRRYVLDASLGFAAGVMLAATLWGLLTPALERAESSGTYGKHSYVPLCVGVLLGAAFVHGAERLLPEHEPGTQPISHSGDAPVDMHPTISEHKQRSAIGDHRSTLLDREAELSQAARAGAGSVAAEALPHLYDVDHPGDIELGEVKLHTAPSEMETATQDKETAAAADGVPALSVSQSPAETGAEIKDAVPCRSTSTDLPADATAKSTDTVTVQSRDEQAREQAADRDSSWRRLMLLVIAVTLHNLPEGLAVGVAFGALSQTSETSGSKADSYDATYTNAESLAIGVGLQDCVEGLAVSLPLLQLGMSRRRAFMYGQLSGLVEPVGGVLGAVAVSVFGPLLPYALAVAGGAMLFAVIHAVLPETRQKDGHPIVATWAVMGGFVIMSALDVGLA